MEPSDAEIYREIRLRSLQENPEAFLTTYEIEREKPIETTRQNLQHTDFKFTLGCFTDNDELVGIVTFVRESKPKITHKGYVFGMYVVPEFRGKRVGYRLISELLQRAKKCAGLEQIHLTVVANNIAAKKLYESVGFTRYGTECNALKMNGQYWDEDLMAIKV
nr:GNAT family protein [Paenactinomyces guangxiensis]